MRKFLIFTALFLIAVPETWSQEFLLHDETFTWNKNDDICGGYHYWYDRGNGPVNWTTPYDYQDGQYYFRFQVIDQPSSEPFTLNMCIWTEYLNGSWKEACVGFSPVLAGSGSLVTYNSPITYQLNGVPIDWTDLTKLWRMGNPLYIGGHNLGNGEHCTDHPELWDLVDSYLPLTMRVTVVAVASGYTFSGWDNYLGGGCTPAQLPIPSYGIDYANERTDEAVPATDEYSYNSNMSGAVSGNGSKLALTPGQDVYFRSKANGECWLASNIQHLVVPDRPGIPSVSVDYPNEHTVENIPSTLQYSISSSYTSPITGNGSKVVLTPGQDLYFWVNVTGSSFYSLVTHLVVPNRPAATNFTIDYANEKTDPVVNTNVAYSTSPSFSNPVDGPGDQLPVTPGQDLYLWLKATSSAFASFDQHLIVPDRPAIPSFAIDFINESTSENVPTDDEYALMADMTGAQAGTGSSVSLVPGSDYYFRVKFTSSSFASEVFHLTVPERPVINSETGDTIEGDFFTAAVDFHGSATGFDAGDVETTNAEVVLTNPLEIKVVPVTTGAVTLKIIANAINEGNYASEVLSTYYKTVISSIPETDAIRSSLLIFPSPVGDLLHINSTGKLKLPIEIRMLDSNGKNLELKKLDSSQTTIDMSRYSNGLYILKAIDADGNIITCKVVKQ